MKPRNHPGCVGRVIFGLLLFAPEALCQDSQDEITRRQLLSDSDAARRAGDHSRALDTAVRAGVIRMTPSVRLLVAQESEALSTQQGHERLALDAISAAQLCVTEASAAGQLNNRELILQGCRTVIDELRPRVAQVVLRVPGPIPAELQLRVNQSGVGRELLGSEIPVLPGPVHVEASSGGRVFTEDFVLARGDRREVSVLFRTLSTGPVGTAPLSPSEPVRTAGAGAGPWIVGGAGALSLGLAGVFYALRGAALSDRSGLCSPETRVCEPAAVSAQNRAETMTLLTNVSLGVGAAALAGGALWWLLGRSQPERSRSTALHVDLSPTNGGLAIGLHGAL